MPKIPHPLVLIGMPGAGKSRIGRMLAQALELPFIDTDAEVESAAGCRVSEIFERFGEKTFRDAEARILCQALDGPVCVISTGGGAPMSPGIADLIGEKALSLWLRADTALLAARTAGQGGRPLLAGQDPEKRLKDLSEKRYAVYAKADLTVDVRDVPAEETLYDVLGKLDDYLS